MGLPWIRLDTGVIGNPKILQLVAENKHRSGFAYVCALAYSGMHGLDGFIPALTLPFIHATKKDADNLVAVGLFRESPGGWTINGWTDYQATSEESEQRRKRAQAAAQARWDKGKGGDTE